MTFRGFFANLLTMIAIALGCALLFGAMALAQQPGLCGREQTIGPVRILIACPDWPAMRAVSGASMFPDRKGQQVFLRTTDPATTDFRVTMRYRDETGEHSIAAYAAVDPRYDSGVGWVLGEIEILGVSVVELRGGPPVVVQ